MTPVVNFLGPHHSANDEYVEQLHSRSVLLVAVGAALLSYLWLFQAMTFFEKARSTPSWEMVVPPLITTSFTVLAFALHKRSRIAGLCLCLGLVAGLYLWPSPARYYLAPLVVCLSGLLVRREAAIVVAFILSYLPGISSTAVASLWLTSLATFLALDFFYAAMNQAMAREEAAVALEEELLQRRGELRRLNDSLRNAYTLLERTNHELAEARDEAEEAKRLKAQFAATISHELRTPLNLILGFSEVMYKMPEMYSGAVLTPDLRGDIREIYRSTQHLLALVDDVLDLSRVHQVRLALVPEEADLREIVEEAITTVSGLFRDGNLKLIWDEPRHRLHCRVDRTRIRQVLINLLINAVRFTEKGETRVSASLQEERGELMVCVSDTGPGIPEEEQARVFDAFYQVSGPLRHRMGGAGLGLAICKTFVQMHGGRIWIESTLGAGSRFCFTLPVRGQTHPEQNEWRLPGAPDPFGDCVVTVEPQERFSRLLERTVPGLKVHNATDLKQAQELVSNWHPKALVGFWHTGEEPEANVLRDMFPWPNLPLLSCQLAEHEALFRYPYVKAVLGKPVTIYELIRELDHFDSVNTLLIVDDNEGMVRLIRRTLQQAQPEITLLTAHDGRQALELMRYASPDAVILDLAIPEIDGFSVLETMLAEEMNVPVLILTAMEISERAEGMRINRMVLDSCLGFSAADASRLVQIVAQVAAPRYIDEGIAAG